MRRRIERPNVRLVSWSHAFIVLGGSFVALTAMIAWMDRSIQRQRESIERRREDWIAGGSIPGEEPNFETG